MSRQFKFKNRNLVLDFEGVIIEIDNISDALVKTSIVGQKMVDYFNNMDTEGDTTKIVQDATDFVLDCIDEVIGDGAADKIFANREPEYFDTLDVFNYIREELEVVGEEFVNRQNKEPIKLNRQQRRAMERKQV